MRVYGYMCVCARGSRAKSIYKNLSDIADREHTRAPSAESHSSAGTTSIFYALENNLCVYVYAYIYNIVICACMCTYIIIYYIYLYIVTNTFMTEVAGLQLYIFLVCTRLVALQRSPFSLCTLCYFVR